MTTPWTVQFGTAPDGSVVRYDLSKGPHLLVCGTTGSGKSVSINALIAGLIEGGSPADTQIVVLDPKMVEFGVWRPAPHVAAVIVDRTAMVEATEALVRTMMARYALLERLGKVDIGELSGTGHAVPRLFLVLDECGDLLMVGRDRASKDMAARMLGALTRLAQLGRAAGVHLIVGTQTPRADILPGALRANLPSRYAHRCRTRQESRVALDGPGAESLSSEPGAALLSWRGATPLHVQARYVSREDCARIAASAAQRYGRGARRGPRRSGGSPGGSAGGSARGGLGVAQKALVACGLGVWVAYCVAVLSGR